MSRCFAMPTQQNLVTLSREQRSEPNAHFLRKRFFLKEHANPKISKGRN
jgi:hypothetical protein